MPIILESNSGVPTIFFLNVRIQVNGFQACCVGTVANTKSTVLIRYSITSKITQSSHHFNKSSLTLVFSFWKEKISACFHNCFVVCSTWQPNCSAPTTISLPNGDESFFVWVMMTPPYLCCSLISFAMLKTHFNNMHYHTNGEKPIKQLAQQQEVAKTIIYGPVPHFWPITVY